MAPKIGKAFKNFYVLIYLFQERRYSVAKLKTVINGSCAHAFQCDDFRNWAGWNSSEVVEVLWDDGLIYPAYFLQFGENKQEMEILIDDVIDGKIQDVPLIQVPRPFVTGRTRVKSKQLVKEKNDGSSAKTTSLKEKQKQKTKMAQNQILLDAKKKLSTNLPCASCKDLQQQISEQKECLDNAHEEIRQLKIKVAHYKQRSKKYKQEKKDALMNASMEAVARPSLAEMVRLGDNTVILKSKLSMCRTTDFSKYVGDLLDVLFTTETLGNSVIKGIKGGKKSNVLDVHIINDLQQHVAEKFKVSVQNVRAAIRQKLNVAHKIIQNNKEIEM